MTTILSHHTVGRRDRFAWLLSTIGVLTILASSTNAQPAPESEEELPSKFSLPGEKSPTMEINEPLISPQALQTFRRNYPEYTKALRQGEITSESRKLVEDGIAARMLRVTIPEEQKDLTQHRSTLMRDIKTYAGRNQPNPRERRKFKQMVLDEVLKNARKMLTNHQIARIFAISVVKDLNIEEEDLRNRVPPEPYEPALDFMREVVNDPEQNDPVKIIALQGIKRILDSTQLKLARNHLLQTAEDLVKELKDPNTHYWMQQNLIRAVRSTQIDVDRAGKPFIVQTLAEVLSDAKRHPLVRAEAAYSIPRVPLPNNVDLSLISWQIAKLTQEMAEEYNKNPQKFWWQAVFFRLYAAFQPIQEGASDALLPISETPAMAKHQAKVLAAYQQSFPVMKAVFDNRGGVKLDPATTAPLGDWLKENDPGEYIVYPNGPPLTQNESTTTTVNTAVP
jgi:hypothetical protein